MRSFIKPLAIIIIPTLIILSIVGELSYYYELDVYTYCICLFTMIYIALIVSYINFLYHKISSEVYIIKSFLKKKKSRIFLEPFLIVIIPIYIYAFICIYASVDQIYCLMLLSYGFLASFTYGLINLYLGLYFKKKAIMQNKL